MFTLYPSARPDYPLSRPSTSKGILCSLIGFLALVLPSVAGTGPDSRVVPPIAPELPTGPQRVQRQSDRIRQAADIQREKAGVQAELDKAVAQGKPTNQWEAALKVLDDREHELRKNSVQDPDNPFWSAFRAKTAIMRHITQDSDQPISTEEARQLVDMLYTDIEPKVNSGLRLSALLKIQQAAAGDRLTTEARGFLRDSMLGYYYATLDQCDANNRGAMCHPQANLFLASAIAIVAQPEDAEAVEAFEHLKQRVLDTCTALQWEAEKSLYPEVIREAEDKLTLKDSDIRGIKYLA